MVQPGLSESTQPFWRATQASFLWMPSGRRIVHVLRLSDRSVRAFYSWRAYFILLSARGEMQEGETGKNAHKQRRRGIYNKSPPLDRRPIQCIYNMTGSSESLLLCLARAPQGRLSLSFLLLFISSRLRTGSEERGRTTGGNGWESLKKGEAHCKQNM